MGDTETRHHTIKTLPTCLESLEIKSQILPRNVLLRIRDTICAAEKEIEMRLATVLLTTAFIAFAGDPFLGTWKVNVEKSKTSTGRPPRTSTQQFEATSDGYRITSSELPKPITLHLDGKDYSSNVQGIAEAVGADKSSARRINSQTIESTFKREGKVVATINRKVSSDGSAMTTHANGVSKDGEKFDAVVVYEKQ